MGHGVLEQTKQKALEVIVDQLGGRRLSSDLGEFAAIPPATVGLALTAAPAQDVLCLRDRSRKYVGIDVGGRRIDEFAAAGLGQPAECGNLAALEGVSHIVIVLNRNLRPSGR